MDLLKKIAAIIFFALTLTWLCRALFLGTYPDFNVFYGGLSAYLHGGNPYVDVEGSVMKFLYPPFALFFFFPLIIFSRELASILWAGSSIVFLVVSIILLFNLEKKKILTPEFYVISGLVFIMFPVKFNLGMGQFNTVNLLLICLFLHYLTKQQDTRSGVSLGLSLLLKVFPLLFLPYLLFIRKWRTLWMSVLIILLGLMIPLLFVRFNIISHFFTTSLPGTIVSWPLDYYNQAFSGFMGRAFGTSDGVSLIKSGINAFFILVTFVVLWLKRTQTKIHVLGFASILPLTLMTLSFSWQHYFVLAAPALILLYFHYRRQFTAYGKYGLLIFSYVLIGLNLATPTAFPVLVQSHVLWGTVLLWALILWEVYHEV